MRHLALVSTIAEQASQAPRWELEALTGRICELSATQSSVAITLAMGLVLDAQRAGETVAWITATHSAFFPPDAALLGIDLHALVVIRVDHARGQQHATAHAHRLGRAADHLARSGGFGLIVIDLASTQRMTQNTDQRVSLPMPLQSRLLGLAQKHQMSLVVLSHKADDEPSLSSLVSLRGQVHRQLLPHGRLAYELCAIKDKHRAPGWVHREVVDGPPGMR